MATFDPGWIRQVLFKLFSNALRFSPPHGPRFWRRVGSGYLQKHHRHASWFKLRPVKKRSQRFGGHVQIAPRSTFDCLRTMRGGARSSIVPHDRDHSAQTAKGAWRQSQNTLKDPGKMKGISKSGFLRNLFYNRSWLLQPLGGKIHF